MQQHYYRNERARASSLTLQKKISSPHTKSKEILMKTCSQRSIIKCNSTNLLDQKFRDCLNSYNNHNHISFSNQ